MKKLIIAVCLLMVMVVSSVLPAFANDDIDKDIALGNGYNTPTSVSYAPITRSYNEWSDGTAKKVVLKYAFKPYGKTVAMADEEKDARAIESGIKAHQIDSMLDDGAFLYVKISFRGVEGKQLSNTQVSLIVTKPDGSVVDANNTPCALIGTMDIPSMADGKLYTAFFDVTDLFDVFSADNSGKIPAGNYDFSLFFGNDLFDVVSYSFVK